MRRACHDVPDLDGGLGAAERAVEQHRAALLHCGQHLQARNAPINTAPVFLNQEALTAGPLLS